MRISTCFPAALLVVLTAVAAADDGPSQKPNPSNPLESEDRISRFEGYRYVDVQGEPLPIQSDHDIETFLAEATIIHDQNVPSGITLPRKLTLDGGDFEAYAIFKDVNISKSKFTEIINGRNHFSFDWKDHFRFDIAAYELDRILGLDRIPPTVQRTVEGRHGSVSIWLTGTVSEFERSRELHIDAPDQKRWNHQRLLIQIFDNLVANRDRNLGNILIDTNWRFWFIDCTRCFGTTKTMYYPLEKINHCERRMWRGLSTLDVEETKRRLAPYLRKNEIKAMLARRDTLVSHFRKLIDERGEDMVLFDIEPSTSPAPWGED